LKPQPHIAMGARAQVSTAAYAPAVPVQAQTHKPVQTQLQTPVPASSPAPVSAPAPALAAIPVPVSAQAPSPAETLEKYRMANSKSLSVQLNGKPIVLQAREGGSPWHFVDMFSFVDIDPKNPKGTLIQTLNGREAPFMIELREGDRIDIRWSLDDNDA